MKLFEDLPSQDTPITAESLNQIKDKLVVVSATEPTGDNREKVWIQKGKNLIHHIIKGYEMASTSNGDVSVAADWYITDYIPVQGNTSYIASGFNIHDKWWFDENKNFISCSDLSNISPSNARYLRMNGRIANDTNIQIEQGTTATAYEAYIEPKIYVLNDNDVYEEFISKEDTLERYSTEEQVIGTWIDGKPLYRKVGYVGDTAISSSETTVRFVELPKDTTPINASAIIYTETSGYGLFVNSTYAEDGFKIRYMSNQHAIQVIATKDVAAEKSFSAYVIVEYTKTTD